MENSRNAPRRRGRPRKPDHELKRKRRTRPSVAADIHDNDNNNDNDNDHGKDTLSNNNESNNNNDDENNQEGPGIASTVAADSNTKEDEGASDRKEDDEDNSVAKGSGRESEKDTDAKKNGKERGNRKNKSKSKSRSNNNSNSKHKSQTQSKTGDPKEVHSQAKQTIRARQVKDEEDEEEEQEERSRSPKSRRTQLELPDSKTNKTNKLSGRNKREDDSSDSNSDNDSDNDMEKDEEEEGEGEGGEEDMDDGDDSLDEKNDSSIDAPALPSREGITSKTTSMNGSKSNVTSNAFQQILQAQQGKEGAVRKVIVILEDARLEVVQTKRGKYELLNYDDHFHILKKTHRDPTEMRPDITHQCLLSLLDSPLNKSAHLQVYIHTHKNVLIEVSPDVRIPRTYKRFAGLMVELLHKFKIRAADGSKTLLKVIKNPVTRHLPTDSRIFGTSVKGSLVDVHELVPALPDERPYVFVVGAIAHGNLEPDYCEKMLAISRYPLSASVAISRVMSAFERKWEIL